MQHSDTGSEPPVIALARSAIERAHAALSSNDRASALHWLERAHRLLPHDPNTILTLATVLMDSDPGRSRAFFEKIAASYDVRQAWFGLAASRLMLTGQADYVAPLVAMLSRHAFLPDATMVAEQISRRTGGPGWCGLRSDGRLEIHLTAPGPIQVFLDGRRLTGETLPKDWERARAVEVRSGELHLLGSPIRIAVIRRLVGCVEVRDRGIAGWAWHPNDPDLSPKLTLAYVSSGLRETIVADDGSVSIPDTGPLARPRGFRIGRAALRTRSGLVHVRGLDGKDLPGSPLDPFADEANHVAAARRIGLAYSTGAQQPAGPASISPALRADAPVPDGPIGVSKRRPGVSVVIPVHDGGAVTLDCLASVMAAVPAGTRILVVDDASSDTELIAALKDFARHRKITLIRHDRAMGFPASANTGIRAAKGRDVVLLNSDTLVPPRWLERLQQAAYSGGDIGTVTPFSNEASILSYPGNAGANPRPDQASTNLLDRLAERANSLNVVDIPVGVGFCLYLRRDCLNATGLFRSDVFAQGYGEENDLCLRARRLGWRNVALTGLFVGHLGGMTFGTSANHLRARNSRIVEQLHPGYDALVATFIANDSLSESRRRIDVLRWRQQGRRWQRATVLITHADGGGVEQRLRRAVEQHAKSGCRPIVLRPTSTSAGEPAIGVHDGLSNDLPNLVYAMPRELPALVRLLQATKPASIEAHQLAGYSAAIYTLIERLDVAYSVHVHDYAWFCPRISLVGADRRYCGEPELPGCEACVADNGHFLKETIGVKALRARSAAFLAKALRVVVPSDDTAARMRRHFDGLKTETVPHEDDTVVPAVGPVSDERPRLVVCVVGAIGLHKGYDVLLACARDAARRDLDLEFIVVGHTIDDARMLDTGRVFITGEFAPDEAVALIVRQQARLGFVPSIWPETWCLTLGDIWRAGLRAAAFDFGAPAERIRRTGRGFLLPPGLSAGAINNALVAAIRMAGH